MLLAMDRSKLSRVLIEHDCSVSGSNPTDYTIVVTLKSNEEMTITNQPNYMVTNSVTAANSGRYTCTVSTSVDFTTLNYDVNVHVATSSFTLW